MSRIIQVIDLGGTFGKIYSTHKGTQELSFSIHSIPATILDKHTHDIGFSVDSPFKKDSLQMTDEDRRRVAQTCTSYPHDVPTIIIHGTDTVIETGACVSEYLHTLGVADKKTVVLTGASTPACMKESNAEFNLGCAIGVVQCKSPGVYIVMHGKIFDWDKCVKGDDGIFRAK